MRVSVLVIAAVFIVVGQSLSVSSCYGQAATKGNLPKAAPVEQASKTQIFTPEQIEKIHEIIKEELVPVKEKIDPWIDLKKTMLWIVGIIATLVATIGGIAIRHSIGGLKKKAESHTEGTKRALRQAQKFVEEIQTIQDNAKKQAEEYFGEMKATGEQILTDLGKTLTHRPRYVLTQGGTKAEPVWKFDLVILFSNKRNSSEYGLLRLSGGTGLNNLTEEPKKQWEEFTIALNEDKSITLERHLTGEHTGKTQEFKGKPGLAPKIIKQNMAMVWEGQWSGHFAGGAPGELIVYLD